jgi:predicted nicotinamide N-methyase
MRLTALVVVWTGLVALVVFLGVAWMVIRYDTDPTCGTLTSACAFDNAALLQIGLIGIPAIWGGGLVVILLWRVFYQSRRTSKPARKGK